MKSNQSGFAILAALGLSAMLMIGAVGVMAMQKSIEDETRHNAIRHSRYVAEDIVKTQVAIKSQQVLQRQDIINFVNSFGDPNTGLRVPVPGTDCGNRVPCVLVILSTTPVVASSSIILRIGVSPAQSAMMKFKIEPIAVTIRIPTQRQINARTAQSAGAIKCNATAPIFKGIKRVGANFVADCGSITPTPLVVLNTQQRGILEVVCNVAQGRWMDSIDQNLYPNCVDFSAEQRVPASFEICSAINQYPEAYRLDGRFNIVGRRCVNKGNPYDFVPVEN